MSLFLTVGCTSIQTERAITTAQYFTPLAIGVVAMQSFGSSE
tara:strand:+ start:42 stop:167 length:126 start_codon:yes stop_codon:yes gene_type:complete